MFDEKNSERMNYMCKKIMENGKILENNGKIWTYFLDNQLKEYLIQYNFNFFDTANRFHEFIAFPYKYDFTEEAVRRHWAFLHAARYLGITIEEEYYDALKRRVTVPVAIGKEKANIDEESIDRQSEENITRQKEIQKFKKERYNMITMDDEDLDNVSEKKNNLKEEFLNTKVNNDEEEEEDLRKEEKLDGENFFNKKYMKI